MLIIDNTTIPNNKTVTSTIQRAPGLFDADITPLWVWYITPPYIIETTNRASDIPRVISDILHNSAKKATLL